MEGVMEESKLQRIVKVTTVISLMAAILAFFILIAIDPRNLTYGVIIILTIASVTMLMGELSKGGAK
jgi:predicted RND superfamily exporter protein